MPVGLREPRGYQRQGTPPRAKKKVSSSAALGHSAPADACTLSAPGGTWSTGKLVSSTNRRSCRKSGFTTLKERIPRLLSPLLSSASMKKLWVESEEPNGPIVAWVLPSASGLQCRTSFGL